jgi:hypothetical protein
MYSASIRVSKELLLMPGSELEQYIAARIQTRLQQYLQAELAELDRLMVYGAGPAVSTGAAHAIPRGVVESLEKFSS